MDKKDVTYTLKIKIPNIFRYTKETDKEFNQRVKEEGKKRARYYLSGYLFDPTNKIIIEDVQIDNE